MSFKINPFVSASVFAAAHILRYTTPSIAKELPIIPADTSANTKEIVKKGNNGNTRFIAETASQITYALVATHGKPNDPATQEEVRLLCKKPALIGKYVTPGHPGISPILLHQVSPDPFVAINKSFVIATNPALYWGCRGHLGVTLELMYNPDIKTVTDYRREYSRLNKLGISPLNNPLNLRDIPFWDLKGPVDTKILRGLTISPDDNK